MYILTIPSFTWIKVPNPDNSPPARAGHTCTLRDGQIIIVGGYTGNTPSCDSPGICKPPPSDCTHSFPLEMNNLPAH